MENALDVEQSSPWASPACLTWFLGADGAPHGLHHARRLPPDGVDQNCDGVDGVDRDGDGEASVVTGGGDCDDNNVEIGADECGGA